MEVDLRLEVSAIAAAGDAEVAMIGDEIVGIEIQPYSGHFMPSAKSLDVARSLFETRGITFPTSD